MKMRDNWPCYDDRTGTSFVNPVVYHRGIEAECFATGLMRPHLKREMWGTRLSRCGGAAFRDIATRQKNVLFSDAAL